MTKEKMVRLAKYMQDLQYKLAETVIPEKHAHRVEAYRAFLKNELRIVESALEKAKLEGVK